MSYRMLGARAAATKLARRFSRRDDIALVDPMTTTAVPEAVVETVVSDVVPVDPVPKTYRATVTRTVTQTAVVEFTAPEGTDSYTMAQGLLESIPAEHWVTQPADSWGYIDHIEEVGPAEAVEIADPLEAPAVLARRARKTGETAREFLASLDPGVVASEAMARFNVGQAYIDEYGSLVYHPDATADDASIGWQVATEAQIEEIAALLGWQSAIGAEELTVLARRYRRKSDAGAARAFLDTLGDETITQEAASFGGSSAYVDEFGDIVVVDASGGERLLTDDEVITLALSCGWQAETAGEGDEFTTLSHRYARKMTGSEAIDWIDSAQQQADTAFEAGDLATLQSLLDQSYGLAVDSTDPADTWAAEFPSALADLQFQLNDKIQRLGEIEAAITEVIDAPTTLARRGRLARRYARKAAFDVTVAGTYIATYEAASADEALAAYLAEQGFATAEDAAAAAGYSVEEFLADIVVSEAPADEIAAA